MEEKKKLSPGLKVFIQIAFSLLLLFLCVWYKGIFSSAGRAEVFRILSDSSFIIGGGLTGIGIISFCIKAGAFSVGGSMEEKKERSQRRRWLRTITYCGLAFLVMANVFAFI